MRRISLEIRTGREIEEVIVIVRLRIKVIVTIAMLKMEMIVGILVEMLASNSSSRHANSTTHLT